MAKSFHQIHTFETESGSVSIDFECWGKIYPGCGQTYYQPAEPTEIDVHEIEAIRITTNEIDIHKKSGDRPDWFKFADSVLLRVYEHGTTAHDTLCELIEDNHDWNDYED